MNAASDSTESQKRGKYNSYTPEQRAKIGKYAAENGPSRAAKHYTAVWGIHINESTARRLKTEYLKMLKKEILKEKDRGDEGAAPREPIVITSLEPKDRGRPLLLGEELDAAVQEFVNNLRAANGVVNRLVVMGAAEKRQISFGRYLSWNVPNHFAPPLDGHCIRIHWIPVLPFTRKNFSYDWCPNVFVNVEATYTTVHHV